MSNPKLLIIIKRFKEPSTWAGIAVLIAAFGIQLEGELIQTITQAGIAVASLLAMFLKEEGNK